MVYHYSLKNVNEHMARAVGINMPLSTKVCIEICNALRGRTVHYAKSLLNDVLLHKRAIPYTRFTNGIGHRPGRIASGAYPEKACGMIIKLIESAEASAQLKGLNTASLRICHMVPNQGVSSTHPGRQRGRSMKSTTIELVVEETASKPKDEKKIAKKEVKAEEKTEDKKEEKADDKKEPAQKKPKVDAKLEKQEQKHIHKEGPQHSHAHAAKNQDSPHDNTHYHPTEHGNAKRA